MNWLAIAVAAAVLAAGWVRERRSDQTAIWRRVAVLLMALSLLILVLQPSANRSVDLQTALVLTPGATRQWVEQNGLSVDSGALFVAMPGVGSWPAQSSSAPDLQTFLRRNPQVDHLRVVGAGLEPWDLDGLIPTVELTRSPSPDVGVSMVHWDRQLALGDPLRLTGSVTGLADNTTRIGLEGPAGETVSAELRADPSGAPVPFTLEITPPGEGRFLYQLRLAGQEGSAESVEPIDVQVVASVLPRILWLEDAPNFETKHWKSWLADQGCELAIRSRVSRDRYHFEFHNRGRLSMDRLNWDLLQGFDLLIAEQRAWQRLTATEKAVVEQSAREIGLGVLIRLHPARTSTDHPGWPLGFSGTRVADVEHLMVRPQGPVGVRVSPVEAPPFELNLEPGMVPLFTDGSGRVLALARPAGRGHFGVTLLRKTYPWVLEGFPAAQHSYWRRLIEAVARRATSPAWRLSPGPILVDEPLALNLGWDPEDNALPEALFSAVGEAPTRVALRQDPVLGSQWVATVWPSTVGWHRLEAGSAQVEFFVARGDSWANWQLKRRERATRIAEMRPRRVELSQTAVVSLPLPRLPFYLVFLVSLGLLWLDERRGSQDPPRVPRPRAETPM